MLRHTRGSTSGALYLSPTGLSPSSVRFPNTVQLDKKFVTPVQTCGSASSSPSTPHKQRPQSYIHVVWANPLSLTTTQGISSISLPPVTEMFHFAGFLRLSGVWITPDGLPHSDICGSWVACTYPQLFAACHVLHRLSVPRHPPYALYTLTLPLLVSLLLHILLSRCITIT